MRMLLLIFPLLALIGLPLAYIRLCQVIRKTGIRNPPYIHLFLIFGSAAALLLSIPFLITPPFAPLGVLPIAFAFMLGPLAILVSSFILHRRHRDTKFHSMAFWSGMTYLGVVTVLFFIGQLLGH